MAGEEVINGVLCDLVYNKDSGETTAFSRADGLPRRLESRAIKGWRYYMDILSIKVNGALDEKTFSITPPEGYVQKTPEQLDAP